MPKPAEKAIAFVEERCLIIHGDLGLIGVTFPVWEVFERPKPSRTDGTIHAAMRRTGKDRVHVVLTDKVKGLLGGQVVLEIDEMYSIRDLPTSAQRPEPPKYSYTLSFMPEITISRSQMPGDAPDHWDSLLLTQRKFYRFDGSFAPRGGPAERVGDHDPLRHHNQHPQHHLHACSERHLRFPVPEPPSVLSVACFALISFDYARWQEYAGRDGRVLSETRKLLPHVRLPDASSRQ